MTLRHAELVLDCGSEPACREAKCLVWSSLEQSVRVFAVGRGEEGHASGVISSELVGAACHRGALEAPDVIEGKFVEFADPVSEGVGVSVMNWFSRVIQPGGGHDRRAELLKALPLDLKRFPKATARCVERSPSLFLVPVCEGVVPED